MAYVFTNGCFTKIHQGHEEILKGCAKLAGPYGMILIGVNSDEWMQKNKRSPKKDEFFELRVENIGELARQYCDLVVLRAIDSENDIIQYLHDLIKASNGERVYLVKGADYSPDQITGANIPEITLVLVPLVTDNNGQKISSKDIND